MNKTNGLVLVSLVLAGCVGNVPLEDLPCPCASGVECCAYTNRCLAPGEVCAPPDGGDSSISNQLVGRPCDIGMSVSPNQAAYNAGAGECTGGLCIKPMYEPGFGGPLDTGAACSVECTQDSDCDGQLAVGTDPADKRCASAFTCGYPFEIGPLACRKLCMCRDFLGPAGAASPTACQGITNSTAISSVAGVELETQVFISLKPARALDLVVMVDNSPSMAPKVAKLNAGFPMLLEALKDPNDDTPPDLRVAIIDSDLGTDAAYPSGSCGPKLLANGQSSRFGDLGRFQMLSSPTACPFAPGAQFLEYASGAPVNFSGDLAANIACLTGNLGMLGCSFEHQLQAFEFALVAKGIGNEGQQTMLRPDASLGLIFLSDEDDCSAATNDGLFGDKPELRGESPSLRCATRAHSCNGANLTTSPPGYPTTASASFPFAACRARTDSCPNPLDDPNQVTDTTMPTECSPLRSIGTLAKEIKSLKGHPDDEILVAGIFGWPRDSAAMAKAEYKIAPVPNPDTADTQHPTVYDYWPVCYDPNHLPSPSTTDPATGFDATAAAWGATGGLRESAFVDEFSDNGMKFSICEPDFASTMRTIGTVFGAHRQYLCVESQLIDTISAIPGLQADCRVVYRTPTLDPQDPTKIIYQEPSTPIPQCTPGASNGNVATDCWLIVEDKDRCPMTGQLVRILRTAEEIAAQPELAPGTKLGMTCRTCPPLTSAATLIPGCE